MWPHPYHPQKSQLPPTHVSEVSQAVLWLVQSSRGFFFLGTADLGRSDGEESKVILRGEAALVENGGGRCGLGLVLALLPLGLQGLHVLAEGSRESDQLQWNLDTSHHVMSRHTISHTNLGGSVIRGRSERGIKSHTQLHAFTKWPCPIKRVRRLIRCYWTTLKKIFCKQTNKQTNQPPCHALGLGPYVESGSASNSYPC